jgi:ABC-2 type transport system ATP-binding protein
VAAPVDGSPSDLDLTSFDGTTIRVHWFPVEGASADAPKPTVLMGPGWGLPGDTNVDAVGVLGALNIASLRDAGYHVVTWDPRGFGQSTGTAMVDSVDHEARDVQRILDWLAVQPQVELDAAGDPAAGMVGGSYGGGIQLVTGAIDCRVDALVPVIAWSSLGTSLYKAETFKQGWASILSRVSATASVDPHVTSANEAGMATGVLSDEDRQWFLDRGPAELVADIEAPTLLVGGTVDTLFTLDENLTNYEILRDAGVPVSMYWFCGGHGVCLTEPGDDARMQGRIIAWLDRYVKGDETVDTGPALDVLDQDGTRYTADGFPLPAGPPITATGSGSLVLTAEGGAGPSTLPAGDGGLLGTLVAPITPTRATNAVDVVIAAPSADRLVLGAPELTLTYRGTVPDGERPTRIFAQLVDDTTGLVVGNQITPIPVVLDGATHEVTVPLEVVSHLVRPGTTLTLQLVATTTAYGEPRLGGTVDLSDIAVSLPVVQGYEVG